MVIAQLNCINCYTYSSPGTYLCVTQFSWWFLSITLYKTMPIAPDGRCMTHSQNFGHCMGWNLKRHLPKLDPIYDVRSPKVYLKPSHPLALPISQIWQRVQVKHLDCANEKMMMSTLVLSKKNLHPQTHLHLRHAFILSTEYYQIIIDELRSQALTRSALAASSPVNRQPFIGVRDTFYSAAIHRYSVYGLRTCFKADWSPVFNIWGDFHWFQVCCRLGILPRRPDDGFQQWVLLMHDVQSGFPSCGLICKSILTVWNHHTGFAGVLVCMPERFTGSLGMPLWCISCVICASQWIDCGWLYVNRSMMLYSDFAGWLRPKIQVWWQGQWQRSSESYAGSRVRISSRKWATISVYLCHRSISLAVACIHGYWDVMASYDAHAAFL